MYYEFSPVSGGESKYYFCLIDSSNPIPSGGGEKAYKATEVNGFFNKSGIFKNDNNNLVFIFSNSGSKYKLNHTQSNISDPLIHTSALAVYPNISYFKGQIFSPSSGNFITSDQLVELYGFITVENDTNYPKIKINRWTLI